MHKPTIVLGFDYGTRRIGLALGNYLTQTARALEVIKQTDWQRINQLIDQWAVQAFVVGLPLDIDGNEQLITQHARRFMRQLEGRYHLPVYGMDERFSTNQANALLRQARASGYKKKRVVRGDNDAVAAQVILEHWLNKTQ